MIVNDAFNFFLCEPHRKKITRSKYEYKLQLFLAEHGERKLEEISKIDVANWIRQLEKADYAQASMAMHRSCITSFFNYCVKNEWLAKNPASWIPRYDERPNQIVTADEDDLSRALTFCGILSRTDDPYNVRAAAIFSVAAMSGARLSNLAAMPYRETVTALQHPDSDPSVGNIYNVTTGGKTRINVVFGEWQAGILRRWVEIRPKAKHNQLFTHIDNGQALGPKGLGDARRLICQLANVPIITFQQMRRSVGTKIAQKFGVDAAAMALGHVSGNRVIKDYYYNPDRKQTNMAILLAGRSEVANGPT